MEHILYWLWLTLKNGMTPLRIEKLIERFGSVEAVYEAFDYSDVGGLGLNIVAELGDKRLTDAIRTYDRVKNSGAEVVPIDSEDYPGVLRNIPKSPYVLYIRGGIPDWEDLLMIGAVGTRRCSRYGKSVTRDICADLVNGGAVIVSGMAEGIDAAASWAAIDAGGKTIAVIGSGIDVIYPRSNTSLYNEICRNGCVISEYPPGSQPSRWKFPQRNRIIAGLSRGVLVTEASDGSGSLITAREAVNIGRRLYAVPGDYFRARYDEDTSVIQRRAKLVNRAEDIFEDLGGVRADGIRTEWRYTAESLTDLNPDFRSRTERTAAGRNRINGLEANGTAANGTEKNNIGKNEPVKIRAEKKQPADSGKFENLSDDEKKIVAAIAEKCMSADELSRMLNTPVFRLNASLTMLELKSVVKRLPGNRFEIK